MSETRGLTTDLSPTFSRKHPYNQRARSNLSGGPQPRAILRAQMHLAKRHLPKHARARLFAWALAMSMWLFAVITGAIAMKPRHSRQRADLEALARLEYLVRGLIITRATELARMRAPKRFGTAYRGRSIATSGLIRALIGSRLRRTLTRKKHLRPTPRSDRRATRARNARRASRQTHAPQAHATCAARHAAMRCCAAAVVRWHARRH